MGLDTSPSPPGTDETAPLPRRRLDPRWIPAAVLALVAVVLSVQLLRDSSSRDSEELPPLPSRASGTVPPTSEATPPTTAVSDLEQQKQVAVAAYLAFEKAFFDAAAIPDPFYAALRQYGTGDALRRAFEQIQAWKLSGRAVRFPPNSVARTEADVVSIDGSAALLRDCGVDDSQLINTATGEVVDARVGTIQNLVTMVFQDGRWLVSEAKVEKAWDGVAGCAAAFR